MWTSAHYVDGFIKQRRGIMAYSENTHTYLKGYKWDTEYHCPFTERKGAYIKRKDFKKIKIIDAYFLL